MDNKIDFERIAGKVIIEICTEEDYLEFCRQAREFGVNFDYSHWSDMSDRHCPYIQIKDDYGDERFCVRTEKLDNGKCHIDFCRKRYYEEEYPDRPIEIFQRKVVQESDIITLKNGLKCKVKDNKVLLIEDERVISLLDDYKMYEHKNIKPLDIVCINGDEV